MGNILTISGFAIFCLASVISVVVYVKSFNNFLHFFKKMHESKWKELGALPGLYPTLVNKRKRAQIDSWIKNETDEKYSDLKKIYSRVSMNENIAGVLIIVSVLFYILIFALTSKP